MINSWSEINVEMYKENPEPFHTLRDLYGEHGLTNIDLFIGGRLKPFLTFAYIFVMILVPFTHLYDAKAQ